MPRFNNCFQKEDLIQYGTIEADHASGFIREQNGTDYIGQQILKYNPSTKIVNTTYHSDCQNILMRNTNDWMEANKSNDCCCEQQYFLKEKSIMPSLINRQLGIHKTHKQECLKCVTKYNKQYTLGCADTPDPQSMYTLGCRNEDSELSQNHLLEKAESDLRYQQSTEQTLTMINELKMKKNEEFSFNFNSFRQ